MADKAADSDIDWEGLQITVMKRNDAPWPKTRQAGQSPVHASLSYAGVGLTCL